MIQFKKVEEKHEEKSDFIVLRLYSSKERDVIINRKQIESVYDMIDDRGGGENKAASYTQVNIIGNKFGFKVREQVSDILKLIS